MTIIDSHVHLMPPRLARAIRRFFEQHIGDQLVYPGDIETVLDRHHADGVAAVWNLPYAHKPGMADDLNAGMAEVSAEFSDHAVEVLNGCTIHPEDPAPGDTVTRAHEEHGARVLKLHCSVGNYDADDVRLDPVYAAAGAVNMPVVVHVGHDVSGHTHDHELQTIDTAADRHGDTTLIVAHCGHYGHVETLELMDKHPNVWADLTPVVFDRPALTAPDFERFGDRLLVGTDAPNVGLTLASQLEWLRGLGLADHTLAAVLGGNADQLVPRNQIYVVK